MQVSTRHLKNDASSFRLAAIARSLVKSKLKIEIGKIQNRFEVCLTDIHHAYSIAVNDILCETGSIIPSDKVVPSRTTQEVRRDLIERYCLRIRRAAYAPSWSKASADGRVRCF
jgi:hypothetical protein